MAARRAYWKGYLKLSLVTCPVALYPASSQSEKTHFHQINRKTGNRLRQQMVDEETGRVVDKEDKGAAMSSATAAVEIEPEELDAVEIESTHTIDIDKFVPEEDIDKRYYERPLHRAGRQERRGGVRRHPRCHEGQGPRRWRASCSPTASTSWPSSPGARACSAPRCATTTRSATRRRSSKASRARASPRR